MKKATVKRKTPSENAIVENQSTLFDYLTRMQRIATSIFEWKNLPLTMDERWLEQSLFLYGKAALLWDDKYSSFINTKATYDGDLNIYGLPTKINCYSFDYNEIRDVYNSPGATGKSKGEEAIFVINNREMTPTLSTVLIFAMRLADSQRIADVNINAQRTPYVILTDENQRHSIMNAYHQIQENTPVIVGDKGSMDFDRFRVLKTDAPFISDKIMDYKQRIWNEFLDSIGINNIERYKKERMIAGETDINNEAVNFNLQAFLIPRQKAANEFNEKYGLSGNKAIKVRVRSDLNNVIKSNNSIIEDYGGQNNE